jgi:S-adenosylmethionine decarboxylase
MRITMRALLVIGWLMMVTVPGLVASSCLQQLGSMPWQQTLIPSGGVVGRHVIAELRGCTHCDFDEQIYAVLQEAVKAAGATLLHMYVHKFEPQGMTGIAVLAESHISFHTWPETGYVAVDVFTCGAHTDPEAALQVLKIFFQAQDMLVWHFDRGRNGYVLE